MYTSVPSMSRLCRVYRFLADLPRGRDRNSREEVNLLWWSTSARFIRFPELPDYDYGTAAATATDSEDTQVRSWPDAA